MSEFNTHESSVSDERTLAANQESIMTDEERIRHDYYAWKNPCDQAAKDASNYYIAHPAHRLETTPLQQHTVSKEDAGRIQTEEESDTFARQYGDFSPAGMAVAHIFESAKFFDDIKCDYLGASTYFGFREISPAHNSSPFDVQFDYNVGVLNGYTKSGNIIHVRETKDPSAKTLEQKLFILAFNVITRETQRLYADDSLKRTTSEDVSHHFDTTYQLKTRALSGIDGQVDLDPNNTLAPLYQTILSNAKKSLQPTLTQSARGKWLFKPEGVYSEGEPLRSVAVLDKERHLLGKIAMCSDMPIGERGVILSTVAPTRSIAS